MAEIEFADGKRVVDDIYVEPIQQVTDGAPERFAFQWVMDRISKFVEKSILREAQKSVIEEHFRQWG
jgi:hypothetical protein